MWKIIIYQRIRFLYSLEIIGLGLRSGIEGYKDLKLDKKNEMY